MRVGGISRRYRYEGNPYRIPDRALLSRSFRRRNCPVRDYRPIWRESLLAGTKVFSRDAEEWICEPLILHQTLAN